ncbi:hypothetical protein MyNCGM70_59540 [Achromobacter xylosoxidans]
MTGFGLVKRRWRRLPPADGGRAGRILEPGAAGQPAAPPISGSLRMPRTARIATLAQRDKSLAALELMPRAGYVGPWDRPMR